MIRSLIVLLLFVVGCSSNTTDDKADLYYAHGTAKLIEKEYTTALDYLIKAAELRADTKILNNLGMAYFFKEQFELAERSFEKALKADPKNSDARNNLASLYVKLNRFDSAEKEYLKVLTDLVYPDTYRIYYNLSLIYEKKGNRPKTIEMLKYAIKNRDDYCPANYQLGIYAKNDFKFKEALEYLKKASSGTCYELPAPNYELAMVQAKLGNSDKAYEKFNDIIERFPTSDYAALAERQINLLGKNTNDTTFEEALLKDYDSQLKKSQEPTKVKTSSPQF